MIEYYIKKMVLFFIFFLGTATASFDYLSCTECLSRVGGQYCLFDGEFTEGKCCD